MISIYRKTGMSIGIFRHLSRRLFRCSQVFVMIVFPVFPLKEGLTSYLTSGKCIRFSLFVGLISHYFAILLERPSLFFNRRHPNPRGSPHGAL